MKYFKLRILGTIFFSIAAVILPLDMLGTLIFLVLVIVGMNLYHISAVLVSLSLVNQKLSHQLDGPKYCSECQHNHSNCIQVAEPGEQPGFPNGEWLCHWCLKSDYANDPKGRQQ